MRLYIFRSQAANLCAFAGDPDGNSLPKQFDPWVANGMVEAGRQPPHNLSRAKIESAIKLVGFQLWRIPDVKSDE